MDLEEELQQTPKADLFGIEDDFDGLGMGAMIAIGGVRHVAARIADAGRDDAGLAAQQILRARLTYGGTTLKFSTEDEDFWWWLMDSPDANAARLILAVLDEPGWRDELPRLASGKVARRILREGS